MSRAAGPDVATPSRRSSLASKRAKAWRLSGWINAARIIRLHNFTDRCAFKSLADLEWRNVAFVISHAAGMYGSTDIQVF